MRSASGRWSTSGGSQGPPLFMKTGIARRRRADGVQLSYWVSPTSTTALVEVRAAVPTIPMFDVRPVRCASHSGAGPHRENWPEAWRSVVGAGFALPRETNGSELCSLPSEFGGKCERGDSPFHKTVMTNRNSPPRAEGAHGSFDCRREAPGGPRTGPQLQAELRPKAIPDHGPVRGPLDPDRRSETGAPCPRASRVVAYCRAR